jgi:hypothetical protein
MGTSLFNLTAELQHIQSVMMNSEGDELPQELIEWLDSTQEGFDRKVEGYCAVIGELEAIAAARKTEADRIYALGQLSQNHADRMKVALKDAMLKLETPKLETTRYKVWVQNAGGKLPIQIEAEDVPDEWKLVQLVIDKDGIRRTLEAGTSLPFAQLLPRGQVLRIK